MSDFKIAIDPNVLNHLGMGLYSNTPAVLTEIISNAWDADATEVDIELNSEKEEVVIKDDGHGMSDRDIREKFLKVGYARREKGRRLSDLFKRQVMGRKGIGKLAMFSLANKIEVTSVKKGEAAQSFMIDVKELQSAIREQREYRAERVEPDPSLIKGTKIRLYELQKSISRTEAYLKKRIARRFSIIGKKNNFIVRVNGTEIKYNDRDFLADLEFLWEIGQSDSSRTEHAGNLKESRVISQSVKYKGIEREITGFIGSVSTPSQLSKDADVSNNTITVISNGRVFEEDILLEFGSAKVFTSYLVGEIVADFLDDNDLPDMATSSRQKLQQNDPRYPVLKGFFERVLREVDKDWDDWRRRHGVEKAAKENPTLKLWLDQLNRRERVAAEKLIGKVNTIRFSGGTEEQSASKKEILKSTLLAFEKLRIKDNLEALDRIEDFSSESFKSIFSSVDDIEASMFYEITSQRLKIIDKFKALTDENELERVVQKYLYKHLWLLDPSWERVTGETYIEQTLTQELKSVNPGAKGARVDIAFKTVSGKHVIIEMKRPKVKLSTMELVAQGKKYLDATQEWYRRNPKSCPNRTVPHIDVIFLLGSDLEDSANVSFYQGQMSSINAKVLTYSDLITQSKQAYQEYHEKKQEVSKFKKILDAM